MSRLKVLFISNLYPNPVSPNMAPYNRQQIAALSKLCSVDVIAPIPWQLRLKRPRIPLQLRHSEGSVYHPTYFYVPGFLRPWYGHFFYWSIKRVAKRLFSTKSYDIILSSWLFPDGWAAARISEIYNLPLHVKVHGTDVNRLKDKGSVTAKSLEVASYAETVICVSRALKERLAQLGCPPEKIRLLYNGVDNFVFRRQSRASARNKLKVDDSKKIILYVGNLKLEKGLAELLRSVAVLVRDDVTWEAVIIGDGPFERKLKQLAKDLDIEGHVRALGSLPLVEVASWMNAATLLCLPSYSEGVPNVVLEGISCGTPVVATRVGGIPELQEAFGDRLTLVPPRDVSALVKALKQVALLSHENAVNDCTVLSWEENAQALFSILHPPTPSVATTEMALQDPLNSSGAMTSTDNLRNPHHQVPQIIH